MIGISFIYPQYLWLLALLPLTILLAWISRRAVNRLRFWGGLGLRCFLLLLIVFALAGIQLRLPSNTLNVIFVLDESDSISKADQSRGEDLIREAIDAMPAGDRAAVVVFGEDALVERLTSEDHHLPKISSIPISTRTDIASALQLALALFPDEGAKRLVLLSDGRENLSYAMKQAEIAALQQIELQYVPLGQPQNQTAEVLIDALDAPAALREGQQFDLGITVESTTSTGATLRVFADDAVIHTQELTLQTGVNHYSVPIQDLKPGFHRYRAQIVPDVDTRLQNNEAGAFTVVSGPPSILLVEGKPGDGTNLARALTAAKMAVDVQPPTNIPATLPELARYDAVILANVPASALPDGVMDALPLFEHDLGKGILMSGGENSFGAGGYLRTPLETALPVFMDVKSRELAANLALVVAVDKSGSMGRCHCDNPDLNQSYTATESGQPKVDIAKEAIMRSAAALSDEDYLGIVTFDEQAHWTLDVKHLVSTGALEQAIGSFKAEGQTNIVSGINAAYQGLKGVNAKQKHIILMTDGWVRTGDLTGLVEEMRQQGVTLSIIAAGEGSAEYLRALAEAGGGRYYPATDMMNVPDIFLKETVKSVGQYIVEEPFYPLPASPSPLMKGIDDNDLPALAGYNGTSPKGTARLDLLTKRGDPLLASWQYGLGRSIVWTSDLNGRWSGSWVAWKDFARFAAQSVNWLLPSSQADGLTAKVSLTDEGAVIHLDAEDKTGLPINDLSAQIKLISPELTTTEAQMQQIGVGQYEVKLPVAQPGTYLVWLGASQKSQPMGQMTLGLVVPYSPEYRSGGTNIGLLDELARVTGGTALEDPVKAFVHNLPANDSAKEIWRVLLIIAALLFPIDVAIRRLTLSRRDWQTASDWVTQRLPSRREAARPKGEPQVLSALFNARDRARQRTQADRSAQPGSPTGPLHAEPPPTQTAAQNDPRSGESAHQPPSPQENQPSEDSFARLREAKKRARRS